MPFVGAVLGAAAGGAGALAARGSERLAGPVAYAALTLLTGAIHLDGFLDSCDALFASVPPERRRAILKDPHHGTYAVAGMFALGSVAVGALTAMPPKRLAPALAFAAALARAATVASALARPDADETAPAYARTPQIVAVQAATFATLGAAAFASSRRAALAVPCAIAGAFACERSMRARFGRRTGDAHGFTIAVTEVAVLCYLAAGAAGRDCGGE